MKIAVYLVYTRYRNDEAENIFITLHFNIKILLIQLVFCCYGWIFFKQVNEII